MSKRLNPRMEEALLLMRRGALEKTPLGWVPTVGATKEPFNTHTVFYLKTQRYVRILTNTAHIRAAGQAVLAMQEHAA